MACSTPGLPVITNSRSLLKLLSIESVMPSNYLILCRPLLLPSIFPSIRVFSSESGLCIRWPKYWSFSFSISPSNEYSGLISFRMDWLDLLAVQGTLQSLLLINIFERFTGFSNSSDSKPNYSSNSCNQLHLHWMSLLFFTFHFLIICLCCYFSSFKSLILSSDS